MTVLIGLFILGILSTARAGEILVYDLHFCIITANPTAHARATAEQLKKEVEILNQYFRSESRDRLVYFRFKSASGWNEVKHLGCPLVSWGDVQTADDYAQLFNECTHPQVRDPNAINFYVYDEGGGINSRGRRNSNRPLVLLDWARLNHTTQSPEEHEMGHAFGLLHVCVPGATIQTPTNIMASTENCEGSGGLRTIGFNQEQLAIIFNYAPLIQERIAGPLSADGAELALFDLRAHLDGELSFCWRGIGGKRYRVISSVEPSFENSVQLAGDIPARFPCNAWFQPLAGSSVFLKVEQY